MTRLLFGLLEWLWIG